VRANVFFFSFCPIKVFGYHLPIIGVRGGISFLRLVVPIGYAS